MANSPRDNLIYWLRDAHAMEVGTLDDLERLARRVEHYPQLKARLEQHVEETRGQERRLRELLEGMNEGTSAVKQTVTRIAGNLQALISTVFSDEMLKNAIATYAFNPNLSVQGGWARFWYGEVGEAITGRDAADVAYLMTTFNY